MELIAPPRAIRLPHKCLGTWNSPYLTTENLTERPLSGAPLMHKFNLVSQVFSFITWELEIGIAAFDQFVI
jgi:hypothetical protein